MFLRYTTLEMYRSTAKARCSICYRIFCCPDCRRNHELNAHNLIFECGLCRGGDMMPMKHTDFMNRSLVKHMAEAHLPVQCRRCCVQYNNANDLIAMTAKCTHLSELIDSDFENEYSKLEEKFELLYEKVVNGSDQQVEPCSKEVKTAIVTPIRSNTKNVTEAIATPKHQNMYIKRCWPAGFFGGVGDGINDYQKLTPIGQVDDAVHDICTPTNLMHRHHMGLMRSTSTPTHPILGGCVLFPDGGGDSPLSDINETMGQNLPQTPLQETPNMDGYPEAPQLKGILSSSKIRISQDSGEKQVTFHDSVEIADYSGQKVRKVTFAQNTVFEQEPRLLKRVFRKPKRMLTPGPQRPQRNPNNSRFQALIKRFENQGVTANPTPVTSIRDRGNEQTVGDYSGRPARAINFKEDSQIVDTEQPAEKERNELFRSCVDSPDVRSTISKITTKIAGPLKDCLSDVLKTGDGEAEIQFKFVFGKRKYLLDSPEIYKVDEEVSNGEHENLEEKDANIWSTVARTVYNVFWKDPKINFDSVTPLTRAHSDESTISSGTKRKCDELSDDETSPLNHKRHKYKGRIQGRPPLPRRHEWLPRAWHAHSPEYN